jgi:hypothetical protein
MKKYLILVLIVLVTGALVIGVLAEKPGSTLTGPAGKSNTAHLYLHEKDADWNIVDDGAWGKMTYNLSGSTFDFVFNGHNLKGIVDTEYTLIYYPDPWPGEGLICLGTGTVDEFGDVHIMGSVDTGNLEDAKIWLVLSDHVECDIAWAEPKSTFSSTI